jgi:hypothetical protein
MIDGRGLRSSWLPSAKWQRFYVTDLADTTIAEINLFKCDVLVAGAYFPCSTYSIVNPTSFWVMLPISVGQGHDKTPTHLAACATAILFFVARAYVVVYGALCITRNGRCEPALAVPHRAPVGRRPYISSKAHLSSPIIDIGIMP